MDKGLDDRQGVAIAKSCRLPDSRELMNTTAHYDKVTNVACYNVFI